MERKLYKVHQGWERTSVEEDPWKKGSVLVEEGGVAANWLEVCWVD